MRIPFKARLLPAVLAGVLAGTFAWADDDMPETDPADTEVVESVSEVPSGKIAGFFSDFLGGEEQSQLTVAGLRDGSISYQPPEDTEDGADGDAAEDVVDGGEDTGGDDVEGEAGEAAAGMGYGNVFITLALAEQLAMASAAEALEGETGMTPEESLNEVLYLRQVEGMGWGQIAREMGVNLGEVISGIRSNRPDKVENAKAEGMAKADRGGRPEHARKVERTDKVEKVAKIDRPERPVKLERPEKVERPEKPARPERPSR